MTWYVITKRDGSIQVFQAYNMAMDDRFAIFSNAELVDCNARRYYIPISEIADMVEDASGPILDEARLFIARAKDNENI